MYQFLFKLIMIILPKNKDFVKFSSNQFDKNGNFDSTTKAEGSPGVCAADGNSGTMVSAPSINAVQHSTAVRIAAAALSIFSGCSKAMHR